MPTVRPRFALLVTLLLAFALRLYRLEAQSIWWDEGISLHLATSSLGELLRDRLNNIHPPLYFILLKGWLALVGVGVFNGRYLSVLASTLQVAAVYALGRRWLLRNPQAVWTAVGLAVLSPLAIIYAQEIRVYALLPLVYLLLLAVTWRLGQRSSPPAWLVFGGLAWLAIHLHYIALLALLLCAGALLLLFYRQQRKSALRHWLLTQLGVGLASLPWFVAVLRNWTAVRAEANAGTFTTEPVPLPFLLEQVWGFQLTGLPAAMSWPTVRGVALGVALWLAVGLFVCLWSPTTRKRVGLLLLAWLLPLTMAFLLWSVRSFSHPRYILMYAVVLLPLLGAVTLGRDVARPRPWGTLLLTGPLLLGVVALSLWGVGRYFFDPTVAKDDMRGVARYLEAAAAPADLIVIPDTDWSLPFVYRGTTPVMMPGLDQSSGFWERWQRQARPGQRVYLLDYQQGTRDWQQIMPFMLERAGQLEAVQTFAGLVVRVYRLSTAGLSTAGLTPAGRQTAVALANGRFGSLVLLAADVEPGVAADSALTLALRWQLTIRDAQRYQVTLRLQDAAGWSLAQIDDRLLDENGRPTDQWTAGQMTTTYHVLPLIPGTPPLDYTLSLGVFVAGASGAAAGNGVRPVDWLDAQGAPQAQQLALTAVQIYPAALPAVNPYGLAEPWPMLPAPESLAAGLALIAVSPVASELAPGQPLRVGLLWQAGQAPLPAWVPRLALRQAGQELVGAAQLPALGRYATSSWQTGEWVREQRTLLVPPTAAGPAELVLSLGEKVLVLEQVTIVAQDHIFSRPTPAFPLEVTFGGVARLVGYDLPDTGYTTVDLVPITLYWEALSTGTAVDYTVFAHMLAADGHLIGQHDAPPANGRRPTTGWVTGEYISDHHPMAFRELLYEGTAVVEVGLYDPQTGARLPTADGRDRVYLPVTLDILLNQE